VGQLSNVLRDVPDRVSWWCPGCKSVHSIAVGASGWTYNGDPAKPTFQPSVKVTYEHWVPPAPTTEPQVKVTDICHVYITDGVIDFLGDCTHRLAGQKVPMPPLPDFMRDDFQES
jgi:hypothetical protein